MCPEAMTTLPLTFTEREEMLSVFIRLNEDDFLRQIAPPPFGDTLPASADTLRIIERLWEAETHWRERAFAAWTLGQMPLAPSEKQTAANALIRLVTNRMKTAGSGLGTRSLRALQRTAVLTTSGVAMLLTMMLLGRALTTPGMHSDEAFWMLISVPLSLIGGLAMSVYAFPVVLPFSLTLDAARTNFVRATAVTALGRLRVPETIGALAEALTDNNGRVRDAAEAALQAVLPTLTPAHYGQLGPEAVPSLCRALNYLYSISPYSNSQEAVHREALLRALLEALGKVGDGRAVVLVEFLALQTEFPRVRDTASSVLPLLLERKEQENAREMLLRAASMPNPPSAELLRPASAHSETPSQELLRPSL